MPLVYGPLFNDEYSMSFDGTDDRVIFNSAIDLGTTSSESIWIKQATPTAGEAVISMPDALFPNNSYHMYLDSGGNAGRCYIRIGIYYFAFEDAATKAAINTTDWIHIAIVRTGADTMILYVNGVNNDGEINSGNGPAVGGTVINGFGMQDNGTYEYQGLIDEYAGWANTVLTAAQVSDIYNNGRPVRLDLLPQPPTAWYRMGDNASFKDPQWLLPENSNKDNASNYSMSFDGVDENVLIGNVWASLLGAYTWAPFSISFWYKGPNPMSPSVHTEGLVRFAWTQDLQFYDRYAGADNIELQFGGSYGTRWKVGANGTVDMFDDEWHHIVFVLPPGSTDGVEPLDSALYIDATLIPKVTNVAVAPPPPSYTWYKLEFMSSGYGYLEGNASELSLFSTELSAPNVATIYNSGKPNNVDELGISGLVGYWKMGENATYKYPQWLLPNNENKDKESNYSLSFDGTNDYVDLGDSDTFSFGDGATDSAFSIGSWVNMVDATDFTPIAKDASGAREYVIRLVFDKVHFYVIDNSTGGYIGRLYDTTLTSEEGNWIHIAVTYDGSSTVGGIKIYLDGARVDDTNYTSGSYTAMENTSAALRIGSQQIGATYSDGNIDEVSIFSIELTSVQVLGYYNDGKPTDLSTESDLIGYWKLGEMAYSGATGDIWVIPDSSINNNTGLADNMTIEDRVGNAPNSINNGLSSNMTIEDRVGNAPSSSGNTLSYNMELNNRVNDTPG